MPGVPSPSPTGASTASGPAGEAPAGRAPAQLRPVAVRSWLREAAWMAGAGLLSLLLAAWALDAWDMSLHVPLVPGGDNSFSLMIVKLLETQTWLGVNPEIGWPYGSATYDMTTHYSDFTQLLMLKALTLVADDPAAIVNTFFLFTFPLVTWSAYLVLRALGFAPPVAAACGVVFSLLPWHFFRGESHLFLSAYYAVPLGCLLALAVTGRVRLAERRPGVRGPRAWLTRRTALGALVVFVAGASDAYFAVLAAAIVFVVGVAVAFARRSPRAFGPAGLVVVALLGTLVLVESPTILWHQANGTNELVNERQPQESEIYGLRGIALVMPVLDHRAGPLRELGGRFWDRAPALGESAGSPLGIVGTLGLLLVLAAVAASAAGRMASTERGRLLRDSGLGAFVAFLVGTVGGGGALVAYLAYPQVRAWTRISPFIAFFALIGVAAALTWVGNRVRAGNGGVATERLKALGAAGLLALCLFAAWDQSPRSAAPDHAAALEQWRMQARFFAAADAMLPPDAPVLQLPYVPFPEANGPGTMGAGYPHLIGYIHNVDLRWSYGAMKSREPDDWQAAVARRPVEELAAAAAAAGFQAVYVDTAGYEDGGAEVTYRLGTYIGKPGIRSDDNRLALFDLRPVIDRLREASPGEVDEVEEALLNPVTLDTGGGFHDREGAPPVLPMRPQGTITLRNPTGDVRRIVLSARVVAPGDAPASVRIAPPAGVAGTRVVRTNPGAETPFKMTLQLPPGSTTLKLATDAPDDAADPRDVHLRLIDPGLVDGEVTQADELAGTP